MYRSMCVGPGVYRSFNPPLNPPELEKIATLSTSDSLSETTGDLCSNSSSSFDGALKF